MNFLTTKNFLLRQKKILAIVFLIVLALGAIAAKLILNKSNNGYVLAMVQRQYIKEEISATGQVKKGEEIDLNFKNSGVIEHFYANKGETVEKGVVLASLDTSQLTAQLARAEAGLALAQAEQAKILAGSTLEEIALEEAQFQTAKNNLSTKQENLLNVKASANQDLQEAYEDGRLTLDDCYLKAYNASSFVDLLQRTYFTTNDVDSSEVLNNKQKIEQAVADINSYVSLAKSTLKESDTEAALTKTETNLFLIYQSLDKIRTICEGFNYRSKITSTDKASLDTHRGYINTALTDATGAKQTLETTKIDNQTNISAAENSVIAYQDALSEAEKNLAITKAGPTRETIQLYEAKVNQAGADVALYNHQIADSKIISPVKGLVAKINKEAGELASASSTDPIIVLVPEEPFEVELEIPETEIGRVALNNRCQISLDAFQREQFSGAVIEIDQAETVIQSVVYYKVRVSLETDNPNIKPGMTADVSIVTLEKDNILAVPRRAVSDKNDKEIVKVLLPGNKIEEREVKTGIKDPEGMAEIINGLSEGEKVIISVPK